MGRVYQLGVQVGPDIWLTEIIGQGGYYTGNMPALAAGYYDVQFFVNSLLRGSGNINWNGTGEIVGSSLTAAAVRAEMDANSTKLAAAATTTGLSSSTNSILTAVGSPLQASSYQAPPSAASIAATTAGLLFVDGPTNPLKVNVDHTVSISGSQTIENYITIPAPVAIASQEPSTISVLRGDTLRVSLPLLGDITTRTKLVMTAKVNVNDADTQAVFQVIEGIGLTCLNGCTVANANLANLTVNDASTGATSLVLGAELTAELAVRDLIWDVQVILSTGIVSPIRGPLVVIADVTRSVT